MFWTRFMCSGVRGGFVFFHPLNFHAVLYGCHFIRGVLGHRWMGVLIFCECLPDVARHVHGDVPLDVDVIQGEFYAAEMRSFPVDRHRVSSSSAVYR